MSNQKTYQLIHADVIDGLRQLKDSSVHCVMTSPPYWGLRDYGEAGQIGLEPTPEAYVERMVEVFREARRVLRDDGTLWLNLGDSYVATGGDCKNGSQGSTSIVGHTSPESCPQTGRADKRKRLRNHGLKPKDLCGIPWRVAFALQADGWYLRSDIIWHKPNPMPESVTDRPTKSHEYLFLLTKRPRYYYDAEAAREAAREAEMVPGASARQIEYQKRNQQRSDAKGDLVNNPRTWTGDGNSYKGGRNARTVWTIPTQSYADAHFATFPEELPRRCIGAGTSERGACPACGAPWRRAVQVTYDAQGRTTNGPRSTERRHESPGRDVRMVKNVATTGWSPSCECAAAEPVPCTVLDPFAGSGTTLLVACRMGRRGVGVEMSEEYLRLAERRIGAGLKPQTYRDDEVGATNDEAPLFL